MNYESLSRATLLEILDHLTTEHGFAKLDKDSQAIDFWQQKITDCRKAIDKCSKD